MVIQANPDALVVYITIRQTTFYIDYSMEEPIVEMWEEKETEVIVSIRLSKIFFISPPIKYFSLLPIY